MNPLPLTWEHFAQWQEGKREVEKKPTPHTEVEIDELPRCDFSQESLSCSDNEEAHYDGKTYIGPWAYMCETHFSEFGTGLGLGRGQRLLERTDRRTQEGGGDIQWQRRKKS